MKTPSLLARPNANVPCTFKPIQVSKWQVSEQMRQVFYKDDHVESNQVESN